MRSQLRSVLGYISVALLAIFLTILLASDASFMSLRAPLQRLSTFSTSLASRLQPTNYHSGSRIVQTTLAATMSSQSNPSPPKSLPSLSFSEAVAHRRSVYALTSKLPSSITDKDIEGLVKDAVLHVPSAFNSQATRCVLLVKTEHQKFWDEAMRILKEKMGDEGFEKTKGRLEGFKGGYGTILFFEDNAVIKKSQERSPAYASLFPGWADHASGMHQFVLWTALEAFQGVGCNLQHYNMEPLVTEMAKKTWSLPEEWEFKAQLVFGGIAENGFPTEPKPKEPTEKTVKVFGV